MSAFLDATRPDYYDRLNAVTHEGVWKDWLAYFLKGVARQSEDALGRSEGMLGLLEEWHKEAAGGPSRVPIQVLDMVASNPYVTVKGAAERLDVAYTTAQRAVERLGKQKVLVQVSEGKRDRVFCAKALLEILEEPAKLFP